MRADTFGRHIQVSKADVAEHSECAGAAQHMEDRKWKTALQNTCLEADA